MDIDDQDSMQSAIFFFPESKLHVCHQQWGQAWSSWEASCHVQHVQTMVFKQKGNISYWAKIGRTVVQNIWNNTNRRTQMRNPEKLDWSRNAHLKNFMFGFCQICEGFWQSGRADVPAERWLRNPGDNRGAIFLFSARFQLLLVHCGLAGAGGCGAGASSQEQCQCSAVNIVYQSSAPSFSWILLIGRCRGWNQIQHLHYWIVFGFPVKPGKMREAKSASLLLHELQLF